MAVNDPLEKILDEIRTNNDLLRELIDIQRHGMTGVDTNPWPVKLSQELMTGEDCDGNDMAYGHDFALDENASTAPPIFQASMLQLEKAGKQFI